jgi:hypothetical protein
VIGDGYDGGIVVGITAEKSANVVGHVNEVL